MGRFVLHRPMGGLAHTSTARRRRHGHPLPRPVRAPPAANPPLLATDVDRAWLDQLTRYVADRGMSFTFWSLNPDSGDTGGILADDWLTVNQDKMKYLTPVLAPLLPVH